MLRQAMAGAGAGAGVAASLAGKRHVIFDLDGTLTTPMHNFAALRQELGVTSGLDILPFVDAQPADTRAAMHRRIHEWEEEIAHATVPAPGSVELLRVLLARRVNVGVVTKNTKHSALISLARFGEGEAAHVARFVEQSSHCILGRDCVAAIKPDPAGLQQLLDLWGAAPEDAVMVGDHLHDLEAGRAASMTTVHVQRDDRTWPDVTDLRVDCLTELVALLGGPALQGPET